MSKRLSIFLMLVLLAFSAVGLYAQDEVELILEDGLNDYDGTRDNTIFNESNATNGGGDHIFAGITAQRTERRALVAFDISDVPEGATITSVTLQLVVSRTRQGGGDTEVSMHRLTKDWGEGMQHADNQEGAGAASVPGDATWRENRRNESSWDNPGGDFVEEASAMATTGNSGREVLFESDGLVADVQAWVNGEADNFGWIFIGDGTAKRFHASDDDSQEEGKRPRLTIGYTTN